LLVTGDDYREITAQCWSVLPQRLRRSAENCAWSAANRRGSMAGNFLEGPDLAADGTLMCVDIPAGRVLSVSRETKWNVICEYDGWPNGLKLRPDSRVLVADHKNGLIEIHGRTGSIETLLGHRHSQRFLGLNDLHVAADESIWFTDQGQTGLQDPAGSVYRWVYGGDAPTRVLSGLPSPNGIRVSDDGLELYVAMTRDNSVWRAPLMACGDTSKVGRFASFYGPTGPDGIHLDRRGWLWVCLPGADTIWALSRRGEVLRRIRFPEGAFPTNLVLDAMERTAYVTCSGMNAVFVADLV
jgi:gluconolactonase